MRIHPARRGAQGIAQDNTNKVRRIRKRHTATPSARAFFCARCTCISGRAGFIGDMLTDMTPA